MKRKKLNLLGFGLTAVCMSLAVTSCGESDLTTTTTETGEVITDVTVSFESQGSSVLTPLTGKSGSALTLPTPKLDGYTFLGWCSDSELTSPYVSSSFPSESITLYAKWNANYNNLKVVLNNGEKSYSKAFIQTFDTNLDTPTLIGATFAGWYTDKTFTTAYDGKMPTADTTVYAKWTANEGTAFVSNTGTAAGDGSMLNPLDFDTAIDRLRSGTVSGLKLDTVYLMGGTYDFPDRKIIDTDMKGTYQKRTIISGIDGDSMPVLDFSKQSNGTRGFDIRADYVHLSNIIVEKAGAYGIYVGGSHNIVENCETRFNRNTGLGIARWDSSQNSLDNYPSDNLILKCTSHDNFDYTNYGEDADGFTAKLTAGHNNVFDSCISYGNSDDGWDLYAKADSGNTGLTKIINCVAFRNGFLSDTTDPNNTSTYTNGRTRDGDGNGFKLGGEVMYGNVYLENCISFENGGHGFTDNSNPGILSLKNCTAYNNGLFEANRFSNYNLARTADSLNVYEGLISVSTNGFIGIDNEDEFRGPVSYSIFLQLNENKDSLAFYGIEDVINGNSRVDELSGKELNLDPTKIFKSTTYSFYTQTLEGANLVHEAMRNADGSINLGDYLKITNDTVLTYNKGNAIGGNLSKSTWEDYNHYEDLAIPDNADADTLLAYQIYNQLFVVCDSDAVYEDLDLYKKVLGNPITWTSSNSEIINIDTTVANPKDSTKGTDTYYLGKVINPSVDTEVTITGTITINDVTLTKDFVVTVKALNPIMGEIEGLDDYTIYQGDELQEPTIEVTNLNGRGEHPVIDSELYDIETSINYFVYGNAVAVDEINTAEAGIYEVTYTISLKGTSQVKTKTITIEIVNSKKPIVIKDMESLTTGVELSLNWAEGEAYLIAVAKDEVAPSASQIKAGVAYTVGEHTVEVQVAKHLPVTSADFNFRLDTPFYGEYTYYVVVENQNGFSNVFTKDAVNPTYITTAEELYALANRDVLNTEYIILSNDIDLTSVEWTMNNDVVFSGVLDGKNHKISNLTINYAGTTYAGLFGEARDAVISNLLMENVNIQAPSSTGAAALIGKAHNCSVTNVHITNVNVLGTEGIGGVIGQTAEGNTKISNVSVNNTSTNLINATKRYSGGLVGCFMGGPTDDAYNEIIITDCYVNSNVTCGSSGYAGGLVGRIKGNQARYLEINNAIYLGTISGKYAGATTGGSDKNVQGCQIKLTNVISFAKIATNNSGNGTMYGRLQSETFKGFTQTNTYFVNYTDGSNNKGSSTKQNALTSMNETGLTEEFYAAMFDLVNTWTYADGMITLK